MAVLPDWMIQRDIKIEPFAEAAHRPGVISYGVSSYGYDVRVGRTFKIFTNVHCAIVDPKHFNPASAVRSAGRSMFSGALPSSRPTDAKRGPRKAALTPSNRNSVEAISPQARSASALGRRLPSAPRRRAIG